MVHERLWVDPDERLEPSVLAQSLNAARRPGREPELRRAGGGTVREDPRDVVADETVDLTDRDEAVEVAPHDALLGREPEVPLSIVREIADALADELDAAYPATRVVGDRAFVGRDPDVPANVLGDRGHEPDRLVVEKRLGRALGEAVDSARGAEQQLAAPSPPDGCHRFSAERRRHRELRRLERAAYHVPEARRLAADRPERPVHRVVVDRREGSDGDARRLPVDDAVETVGGRDPGVADLIERDAADDSVLEIGHRGQLSVAVAPEPARSPEPDGALELRDRTDVLAVERGEIGAGHRAELEVRPVEPRDAPIGREPQIPGVVLEDAADLVGRQVLGAVLLLRASDRDRRALGEQDVALGGLRRDDERLRRRRLVADERRRDRVGGADAKVVEVGGAGAVGGSRDRFARLLVRRQHERHAHERLDGAAAARAVDLDQQLRRGHPDRRRNELLRQVDLHRGAERLVAVGLNADRVRALLRDLHLEDAVVVGEHAGHLDAVARDLDARAAERPLSGAEDGPANGAALLRRLGLLRRGRETAADQDADDRGLQRSQRTESNALRACAPLRPLRWFSLHPRSETIRRAPAWLSSATACWTCLRRSFRSSRRGSTSRQGSRTCSRSHRRTRRPVTRRVQQPPMT